jgi:hypothetical protein
MTDSLTMRDQPDRSKINMTEDYEVHYWTKHLEGRTSEDCRSGWKFSRRCP